MSIIILVSLDDKCMAGKKLSKIKNIMKRMHHTVMMTDENQQ